MHRLEKEGHKGSGAAPGRKKVTTQGRVCSDGPWKTGES